MGSAGLMFDAGDVITASRLLQKTLFRGTGAQINALTTTADVLAFCTSTGSGFTVDHFYWRNQGNTIWNELVTNTETMTLLNKTYNLTNNTLTDDSAATGDLPKHNGTKFVRMARGTARQVLRTNSGATDLEYSLVTGGSLASGVRRPNTTTGTKSFGNASTSSTAYSSAIGQVSHTPLASGNKLLILINGTIRNTAATSTARTMIAGLHIDGSEIVNMSVNTGNGANSTPASDAGTSHRGFCLVHIYTSVDTSAHTFDLRVKSAANAADSGAAADEVTVNIIEFGGAD